MAKDKQYTGKDIQSLTDREHVRLRTQVYLGSMHPTAYSIPLLSSDTLKVKEVEFIPAVYKAINEIIDNSIDEFAHITMRNKVLRIDAKPAEGWYRIGDNGRGVPIDKHATGKYTPEVVFGSLRSGRNFHDEKEVGVIGMNGVGSSCTNYCSESFEVEIHRDGKQYLQTFRDGANIVSKPKITAAGRTTGTALTFTLDADVFQNRSLPDELIRNRALEIAMMNNDLTVEYNGEKFKFKNGLQDYIARLAGDKLHYAFPIEDANIEGEIHVIMDAHDGQEEQMFTWVNSSFLFDGGKCNTQFFNALFDRVIAQLTPAAKKVKAEVTRNDVRAGMLVFANLKIKNPEYDSQAKTRLTGPDLRKDMNKVLEEHWTKFSRKAKPWFEAILERATERHHRTADREAAKEHKQGLKRKPEGLLDATSKNRSICQILITEGASANGQISMSRDPETTGAFALTGKINNVYDATVAQVLKMTKVQNLLASIGLVPGEKLIRSQLNFGGKIVIATDADYDGDDIFTLLINLFYKFWPEMFSKNYEPLVYRMIAPNVCLVKGDKRIHFSRRAEYEKVKDKYKGYEVKYYKGLGSMNKTDWDMCLSGETDTFIPIIDDGKMGEAMRLLFSDNADARKDWLTATE